MPLSDRFWIATADTLLFESVRYVAHYSEVLDREGYLEG